MTRRRLDDGSWFDDAAAGCRRWSCKDGTTLFRASRGAWVLLDADGTYRAVDAAAAETWLVEHRYAPPTTLKAQIAGIRLPPGRPVVSPEGARRNIQPVRLTDAELSALRKGAAAATRDLSEHIRRRILGGVDAIDALHEAAWRAAGLGELQEVLVAARVLERVLARAHSADPPKIETLVASRGLPSWGDAPQNPAGLYAWDETSVLRAKDLEILPRRFGGKHR